MPGLKLVFISRFRSDRLPNDEKIRIFMFQDASHDYAAGMGFQFVMFDVAAGFGLGESGRLGLGDDENQRAGICFDRQHHAFLQVPECESFRADAGVGEFAS